MASPYQVQEEGKEFYKDNEWPDNLENIQRRSPSFCLKAWLPFSIQTVSSHHRGPRPFKGTFPKTCPLSPSTAISQPGLLLSAAIPKVATGKLEK